MQTLTRFLRTPKGTLTAIFVVLFAIAGYADGFSTVLPHLLAGILGAAITDAAFQRAERGRWQWPSSAILSGAIVAAVLGTETAPLVTAAVGILATLSKQVLRTRRGHLFNPAALALVVSIPLFATGQSWWGALPDAAWPWLLVLLALGAMLVDRINKFPLVLAFGGVYFGLFTLVGVVNPGSAAEMFRTPFVQTALFFGFFMLTDPPTSPGRYGEQVAIGALVAAVSVVAQLANLGQSYLLLGLLAGNVALAARRWLAARGTASPSPAPSPAMAAPRPLTGRGDLARVA